VNEVKATPDGNGDVFGRLQHSIDAKGAPASLPDFASCSPRGADKLFITPDLIDPCLSRSLLRWQRLAENRRQIPSSIGTSPPLAPFIAPRAGVPVDKLGRILIPPSLREHVGLSREITWAGTVERIRDLDAQRWAELQKRRARRKRRRTWPAG